jgi:hypothetical protein
VHSQPSLTATELQPTVHRALRAWHTVGGPPDSLLGFLHLVQQRESVAAMGGVGGKSGGDSHNPVAVRLATNQVLLEGIEELATRNATGARVLSARFPDNNTLVMVANQLNVSQDQISRLQRAAIHDLTAILLRRELALREGRVQTMAALLPPPTYDRLFGLEKASRLLLEQAAQPEAAGLLTIVGIGGIGKTALADNVCRELIRESRFEQVIWLRVDGHTMSGQRPWPDSWHAYIAMMAERLWPQMPVSSSTDELIVRLRHCLKMQPHLIVIDNLESEADLSLLLEHLADLAGPSKFLLTTRTRPPSQSGVFSLVLDELSFEDTAALLRHHARTTGVPDLAEAHDDQVAVIHGLTGGNPLAIKLVVSLAAVLSLPQVLKDLMRSRPGPVEEMYRHIYLAAWQTLSPPARRLLQAMPLIAESGGQPEQLQAISRLSNQELWPAISELASRSLLEVRGTVWERRYGIHRLTQTFLCTEIIEWPDL